MNKWLLQRRDKSVFLTYDGYEKNGFTLQHERIKVKIKKKIWGKESEALE